MPLNPDVTDKIVNVTEKIDKFLWRFPRAAPKEVCRSLGLPYGNKKRGIKGYGHMVATRKNLLKKFIGNEVKGRLPKPLLSAHRVEWEIEKGVPMEQLLKLKAVAEKCRPRLEDPRPIAAWYVIPNRNGQLEYHDEFVSIRVFPGTGTCRIQPSREMDYKELGDRVWEAFLSGGLFTKECDELLLHLEVGPKHKTFRVGPVTPFKIDYYKDSVGLVFQADGTHPEHIEGIESWPVWVRPLIQSNFRQTEAQEKQTEAITLLTEQMKLHLSVLGNINENFKLNVEASRELKEAAKELKEALTRTGKIEGPAPAVPIKMGECPHCRTEKPEYADDARLNGHIQANHWKLLRPKQHGKS